MTISTTKHSFSTLVAAQQAAKHNSDLTNLANAHAQVSADILDLVALRDRISKCASLIEGGSTIQYEVVKKLYNEATSNRRVVL